MNGLIHFSNQEMALIRQTVAKDCNDAEFDMFLHICRTVGLDPLRRQIYAFVFYKGDAQKRQLTPVVAIDGLRAIASRTGAYRPDDKPPVYEYDEAVKNPDTNPLGIVSCTVTVYKHAQGEWWPAAGQAFWDEYVPLFTDAQGVARIDRKKTGWVKMPRVMIAKCAEAGALRRAWPDDFGMIYEGAELDRGQVLDLSPSEAAAAGMQEDRLAKIGGADAIMIDWMDGQPLARVPLGQAGDRIAAFIQENVEEPMTLKAFEDRNRESFREFWARNATDALEIKKKFETAYKQLEAAE